MIQYNIYSEKLQTLLKIVEITDTCGVFLDNQEALFSINTSLQKIKTKKKKVMIVGNGGSAATASHLQNDLCKAVQIRAMVFTDIPLLTALSNDINYSAAYNEQLHLWADEGDMLIAISSSGSSQNILNVVSSAREHGCHPIITLTGFHPDNPLRKCGDINCYIPSMEYGYVELAHSVIAHYLSDQAKD